MSPLHTRLLSSLNLLAIGLLAGAAQAGPLPARQSVAITDVTVVDLEHARRPAPRTVLVDDGRIVALVDPRDARIPAQAVRIDGRGRFLIPGLVDLHVHLFNTYSRRPPNDWAFALFVANGVTAVREMNADAAALAVLRRWREQRSDGALLAPRLLAAGIAVRGGSPDDTAREVDAAADAGADFVKVFSEVPAAAWPDILAAAKRRSLPVAGHTPARIPLLSAAAQGLASNEHLAQAFEACSSLESVLTDERRGDADGTAQRDAQEARALQTFDARTCRRVAAALAATGQVQVPTLVLAHAESQYRGAAADTDPRWRYLRHDEQQRWSRALATVSAADTALARQRWPVARRIVSAFHRAGVPVLAGTDAPMPGIAPGFALHEELALLVEAGLSPRAALRAATLEPARFLGIAAESGSVAAGRRADLVLLDADPTQDIRHTQRIRAVVLDGRVFTRAALDALLDEAAQAASTP